MAFSSSLVLEVQSGASDSNGGGFDPGLASIAPMTDGAPTNANTATPTWPHTASYTFVAGDVNHWLYVKAGTSSTPGWYKITAVDGSGNATLDAAVGHAVLAAGTPNTVAGCATVASPTTQTWLIDYSQVTGGTALTHLTIDGTTNTKFNCSDITIGKNLIGNLINVTGGTGFTVQRIGIVSTSGTTATADKSLGTLSSSGGTGTLGGAFASIGQAGAIVLASNTIFQKSGSYSITSASTNVAGGCLLSSANSLRIEGYGSVRGDLGTMPVNTASAISTFTAVALSGSSCMVNNLKSDCASLTASASFNLTGPSAGYKLVSANSTANSAFSGTGASFTQCLSTGHSGFAFGTVGLCESCVAANGTGRGFSSVTQCNNCIAYNNSGAAISGFVAAAGNAFRNCISYNNGQHGFNSGANGRVAFINCIAEGNAGTGILASADGITALNCSVYNNGTNTNISGAHTITSVITLTASAFVAAASGNFALNANAGGGALARAAGIPGVTPDGLSTGYLDIGAIQSPPLWPPARAFTAGSMN